MEIIDKGGVEEGTEYSLEFRYVDDSGAGFGFPCTEKGELLPNAHPLAVENYNACLTGSVKGQAVVSLGVQGRRWTYRKPAVGRCHCGHPVTLDGFTNTCDKCGTDYNSCGQMLAPREQWGEETGETVSDIYNGRGED